MSANASHLPAVRPISFEEFRDAWEAQDAGKGLAALMQKAILRLLNALVALLADLRARAAEAGAMERAGRGVAPARYVGYSPGAIAWALYDWNGVARRASTGGVAWSAEV